jgi:SAM-dependent methyltransferase
MMGRLSEAKYSLGQDTREPDWEFFSRYWARGSALRRPYQYQWFLRPCRDTAFSELCSIPSGPILEVGGGLGSLDSGELNPSTHYVELFPDLVPRGRGVVGDAQMLPLSDGSVAAVWTQTISMHIEFSAFLQEAHRILKANGLLIVIEPLMGNPLLRLARRLLPARKTRTEYLRYRDLTKLTSRFRRVRITPFYVLSPTMLILPYVSRNVVATLQAVDEQLLRHCPALSRYAWYGVGILRK